MPTLAAIIASATISGAITAEDTLVVRREVFPDGVVASEEAEKIMALNALCRTPSPEWVQFYIESISDYVVHQAIPAGYVDIRNADWLMRHIVHDGRVDSLTELELLVKVVEVAAYVPDSLKSYVLKQVENAVLTGEGPTRQGALDRNGINAIEVELLRRVLFAQAGDEAIVVSRAEADMLFRLKDATLKADNAPGWADLFVRGVGNHLMALRTTAPFSREEQMAADVFLAETDVRIHRFIGRMFGIGAQTTLPGRHIEATETLDARVAADQAVTPSEKGWLDARLAEDAQTDELEEALMRFIERETATA